MKTIAIVSNQALKHHRHPKARKPLRRAGIFAAPRALGEIAGAHHRIGPLLSHRARHHRERWQRKHPVASRARSPANRLLPRLQSGLGQRRDPACRQQKAAQCNHKSHRRKTPFHEVEPALVKKVVDQPGDIGLAVMPAHPASAVGGTTDPVQQPRHRRPASAIGAWNAANCALCGSKVLMREAARMPSMLLRSPRALDRQRAPFCSYGTKAISVIARRALFAYRISMAQRFAGRMRRSPFRPW